MNNLDETDLEQMSERAKIIDDNNLSGKMGFFVVFIRGILYDNTHLFNTIYFILSILGIYYHWLFAFLLLDIITKVNILGIVIKAII